MANQDSILLESCTRDGVVELFAAYAEKCEHPMDKCVIGKLKDLLKKIGQSDDDYEIYRYRTETDELWGLLLEKAIKCLRYYDEREPFVKGDGNKKPKAYGIEDLKKYYKKYSEFEKVLYGTGHHYRDHVIHVIRTWLSGIYQLTMNGGQYLKYISIQDKKIKIKINEVEKISIWTIIALTHDLGYPLQKARGIIDITRNMLSTFISNPSITADFSFHGVQNYINDHIIRLMSSKMEQRNPNNNFARYKEGELPETTEEDFQDSWYVARLQSKYYFKFQKSLEGNNHGILSTLIIYKLLTYFLESDYNVNEDYIFNHEECRQFYIRREILRAIAAHTCNDVYQMYMGSFSFLIRVCDDTQEWGRKTISELYVNASQKYKLKGINLQLGDGSEEKENRCVIQEESTIQRGDDAIELIHRFYQQAIVYITIFRDGQDTNLRDFSFSKELLINIDVQSITLSVKLDIDKSKASTFTGEVKYSSDKENNLQYGKDFLEELSKDCEWKIYSGTEKHKKVELSSEKIKGNRKPGESDPSTWTWAEFSIPLSK